MGSQQDTKPFITCHVLDTTAGKPAPNIAVALTLVSPHKRDSTTPTYHGLTNSDGRVATWNGSDASSAVNEVVGAMEPEERMEWRLSFAVEKYYGEGNTFWTDVELKFACKKSQGHYHVPLLLGPWSYTTYRGS